MRLAVFAVASALGTSTAANAQALPVWAYPVATPSAAGAPTAPVAAASEPRQAAGSTQSYTTTQIKDLFNVPDWFPEDHPKMADPVGHGRPPAVYACGYCHLPNGLGRPENQSIAGLPKEYILQQMKDFASGARHSAEPKMPSCANMILVSKAVTPEEVAVSADYFSKLKLTKWIRVVETDTVPKTRIVGGMLVTEASGTEPIGSRVVEVSENLEQTELRNSRSGFIAYVPTGSLKAGEALVKTGGNGKTMACGMCHGPDLKGMGNIPGIAGRSPSQMARALIDFRTGARNGSQAAMMKMPVAKLTDDDVVAITSYLSSLEP
jgi:cytochrome c553